METHFKNIEIENFRVFNNKQFFKFAPISILTGTNSSGKSSLINAIKLLSTTYESYPKNNLQFDAEDIGTLFKNKLSDTFIRKNFGNSENIQNFDNTSNCTSFSYELKDDRYDNLFSDISFTIKFNYEIGVNKANDILYDGALKSIEIKLADFNKTLFVDEFNAFLEENYKTSFYDYKDKTVIEIIKKNNRINGNMQLDFLHTFIIKQFEYYVTLRKKVEHLQKQLNENDTELIRKEISELMGKYQLDYEIRKLEYLDVEFLKIHSWKLNLYEKFSIKNRQHQLATFSENTNAWFFEDLIELSFLQSWCNNDDVKVNKIRKILNDYYKKETTYANDAQFNIDVFKLLSNINWTNNQNSMDFSYAFAQKYNDTAFLQCANGEHLSLKMLLSILIKSNIDNPEHIFNISYWQNLSNNHEFFINLPDLQFIEEVFIPFLQEIFEGNEFGSSKNFNLNTNSIEKIMYANINHLLSLIEEPILKCYQNLDTISVHRTNTNRFFEIVHEKELNRLKNFNNDKSSKNLIIKILKDFDIAEDIDLIVDEEQMTYKIFLINNNRRINIKDFGYGILKLIPFILSLQPEVDYFDIDELVGTTIEYKPSVIIIEEPESNLHPALQSKLADLFLSLASTYKIQFIIETHSEYLIRKLQYLTATKALKTSDTQIYYFHHPDRVPEGEKQIYPINIREEGSLTKNFGVGFLDEAGKQQMNLYSVTLKYLENGSSAN